MSIVQSCYLLKSQETSNPNQEDLDSASNSSSVSQSEEIESLGPIGFGIQQATNALQSVVGTLNVGILVYNKKFGKKHIPELFLFFRVIISLLNAKVAVI